MRIPSSVLRRSVLLAAAAVVAAAAPRVCLAQPTENGSRQITDVFVGRGTVGPYVLSWRGVEVNSETVTRGAVSLSRNVDYTLNAATGVLTFTSALRTREIARVDYLIRPGPANPNPYAGKLPVDFRLVGGANANLNLDAAYYAPSSGPVALGTAAASGPAPGTLLFSLSGAGRVGSNSVVGARMMLPGRGGNLLEGSALRLDDTVQSRLGKVTAGYTRAGSGFLGPADSGFAAGVEQIEAGATLNPIGGVAAAASFVQVHDGAPGQRATTTTLAQKLSGRLGAVTRFVATRSHVVAGPDAGEAVGRTTDRLQVDQPIGDRTRATAVFERTRTEAGGDHAEVQNTSVTLSARPAGSVDVSAAFRNEITSAGPRDIASANLGAALTDSLRLTAGLTERHGRGGALHSRGAELSYSGPRGLTLTGGLDLSSDSGATGWASRLSASARPLAALELDGSVVVREAQSAAGTPADAPDTYDMRMSVALARERLKLTGAVARNPEEKGVVTRVQRSRVGMQSRWGAASLAGSVGTDEDYLASITSTVLDFTLGYRFGAGTMLTTGFRDSLVHSQTLTGTRTYTVRLTHQVSTLFDLSLGGSVTDSLASDPAAASEYTADAKLGIRF
ncbi:MAG: hypothetical protein IT208_04215 [Chthonomonadales bacterium]|nr:hypothetical protein [Chthonomonadales bacterium]